MTCGICDVLVDHSQSTHPFRFNNVVPHCLFTCIWEERGPNVYSVGLLIKGLRFKCWLELLSQLC